MGQVRPLSTGSASKSQTALLFSSVLDGGRPSRFYLQVSRYIPFLPQLCWMGKVSAVLPLMFTLRAQLQVHEQVARKKQHAESGMF